MPVQTKIILRGGTAAQWTSVNPILSAREIGLETDTNRTKFGNGTLAWADLPYSVADASGTSSVDWTSVLNKPTTFPPSAHTHAIADVTNLQTALDGKAALVHTHVKADITDFAHTHLLADITDYTPPVIPEVTFTNTLMLMGA
jgi:hypothetical protein